MHIVIAQDREDKNVEPYIYLADHEHFAEGRSFENDWDRIIDQFNSEPDPSWNIDDVVQKMKEKGWEIILARRVVTVTY